MDIYTAVNILIIVMGVAISPAIFNKISNIRLGSKLGFINRTDNSTVDKSNNYIFILSIFLLLLTITVFRSPDNGMSVDYGAYLRYSNIFFTQGFSESITNPLNIPMEPGAIILISLLSNILPGTIIPFIAVTGAITIGAYLYRLRKDSDILWLSTLILVTFGSFYVLFNGITQAFAIAICFLLITPILYRENSTRKHFFTYAAIVAIVAIFIHKSVALLLPAYFILKHNYDPSIRRNRALLALLVSMLLLGFIFTDAILKIGYSTLFPEYNMQMINNLPEGSLRSLIRPTMIILIVLALRKYLRYGEDMRDRVAINSTVLFLAINLLSMNASILQRFSYLFIPFTLVLIPNLVSRISNNINRWKAILLLVLLFLAYGFATMYVMSEPNFKFIWEYEESST